MRPLSKNACWSNERCTNCTRIPTECGAARKRLKRFLGQVKQKDRLRTQHDYQVNLKAELEIRLVHEKLDHLLITQWQRLMEIQTAQIEEIGDIKQSLTKRGT